jgi:hypothetical protein
MTPNARSVGRADRLVKQALGRWPFGYQTEYSPSTLGRLLATHGFEEVGGEAVLRRRLSHDNRTFKFIRLVDQLVGSLVPDWGFYTYAFARRPQHTWSSE